ncbi:MAG TPA: cytidylate kinase family protein, partial [Bacteroidales bacterium]|nr:cytidylate kinase family protein [Bacteroidales bacterium]
RVMHIHGINEKQARERIDKTDKQRESYYNYFSSKLWGAAGSYHLCINTSVLGIEETTDFIKCFAEKRFRLTH